MINAFFVYSHMDEQLRDELEKHLAMLKREGIIGTWHDRRIGPGKDIDRTIDKELEGSRIILLLVSSNFLSSDYCFDIEMKRAMEKHKEGSARAEDVIPTSILIVRRIDVTTAPIYLLVRG